MDYNNHLYWCVTLFRGQHIIETVEIPNLEPGKEPYNYAQARVKGEMKGFFGREDYVQTWCDFYNKKITRSKLRKILSTNK